MTQTAYPRSRRSRLGEVALWSTATLMMFSVHTGAAYYLMQDKEMPPADGAPPAAIMIELAALPEAVSTDETVDANDQIETEEVKSDITEPVDEPLPEEPQPEPIAEPIVEEPLPPEPEPPQEITEPVQEELPPDPVQDIDPVEQQQMAALENVEVPLPVLRPPPPPVEQKVEKEKEQEKRRVEKPTPARQQQTQRDIAKAEAPQSDRNAAPRSSAGLFSSSMTPAKWRARIQAQIARKKPRGLKGGGAVVTVSFVVSESGSLNSIRLLGSTGDPSMDNEVVAWIENVSSVEAPPADVNRNVKLPIEIR